MRYRKLIAYPTAVALLSTTLVGGSVALASRSAPNTATASSTKIAAVSTSSATLPVRGTIKNAAGTIVGTAHGRILRFTTSHGKLYATTVVGGVVSGNAFSVTRNILVKDMRNGTTTTATAVVPQQTTTSCQILNLFLGPLDLNLLGLRIQLNRVHLDITAVPGAGNLLGNLLCSIVHLFDGTGFLQNVSALLNQVLSILGKLGL